MNGSTLLSSLTSPAGLRRVLWFDAASGAGTGTMQLALSAPLAQMLGLPVALLQATGVAIFAFVALAAWLALQPEPPRGALGVLIGGNFAWVSGCLWLAWGGSPGVTAFGVVYLMVQAAVVLVLAELQSVGRRRIRAYTPA